MVRGPQYSYRTSASRQRCLAQALAKELVAMQPEVIFAMSRPATAALQKETSTIPIVFTYVIDPIGAGFIGFSGVPGQQPHGHDGLRPKRGRQMAQLHMSAFGERADMTIYALI